MFERDAFNDALPFQPVQTIGDLVLVGGEQRPAALQGDADLRARETPRPIPDEPPDGAGNSALVKHKLGNGGEP
jgi:hypothetical protein